MRRPILGGLTALIGAWSAASISAPVAQAAVDPAPVTYAEPFRPQVHFTPARNWINDPNGLVYLDGEYHLFYQYNPEGTRWGHMSWGHAVSPDLLHWRELPVAIPEDDRVMIFSGSIVVDRANTSGFGQRNGIPLLVAIYTAFEKTAPHGQSQHIAYSQDRGRTWTKYPGNPVVDLGLTEFRDPKVFWHEGTHRWVMVTVLADRHKVALFGSPDLRHWTRLSEFGPAGAVEGVWECPDLFALPLEGRPGQVRWVLKVDVSTGTAAGGSGAQYFVGQFDGARFLPEGSAPFHWVDYGMDFYAAVSWGTMPSGDQRRVWIGWMNGHQYAQDTPTAPWRGAMSVPRELSLREGPAGPELRQRPVAELATLRGAREPVEPGPPLRGTRVLERPGTSAGAREIDVELEPGSAREVGLRVHVGDREYTEIGYDVAAGAVYLDRRQAGQNPAPVFPARHAAPFRPVGGVIRLHVIVDASSVEVFAGDGQRVITDQVFPSAGNDGLELFSRGGDARVVAGGWWRLAASMGGPLATP